MFKERERGAFSPFSSSSLSVTHLFCFFLFVCDAGERLLRQNRNETSGAVGYPRRGDKARKNRRRAVQVGEEANRETLRAGVERIEIVCYFELHRGGESGEEV